uniref:Uncharacterized protein n=1 Tax=Aegilops tauschii subsp. strangulata TaxID=200361 RepID=A0A453A7S4_AEGTS
MKHFLLRINTNKIIHTHSLPQGGHRSAILRPLKLLCRLPLLHSTAIRRDKKAEQLRRRPASSVSAIPSMDGRAAAMVPRVEVLAAGRARLEAVNALQHESWEARDVLLQCRLLKADESRRMWEANCMPSGDDHRMFAEPLKSENEDLKDFIQFLELENEELKVAYRNTSCFPASLCILSIF